MSYELTFFDFKRKHGLGFHDICKITGCTFDQSKEWTRSNIAPKHIMDMVRAIDVVIDRIKTDNGIFTDVDAQHAAHIIEGLNNEIDILKAKINHLTTVQIPKRDAAFEDICEGGKVVGIKLIPAQEVGVSILSAEARLIDG